MGFTGRRWRIQRIALCSSASVAVRLCRTYSAFALSWLVPGCINSRDLALGQAFPSPIKCYYPARPSRRQVPSANQTRSYPDQPRPGHMVETLINHNHLMVPYHKRASFSNSSSTPALLICLPFSKCARRDHRRPPPDAHPFRPGQVPATLLLSPNAEQVRKIPHVA